MANYRAFVKGDVVQLRPSAFTAARKRLRGRFTSVVGIVPGAQRNSRHVAYRVKGSKIPLYSFEMNLVQLGSRHLKQIWL